MNELREMIVLRIKREYKSHWNWDDIVELMLSEPIPPRQCPECGEYKTANQWSEEMGIEILDPDGWDRKSPEMDFIMDNIPIPKEEYLQRMSISTCLFKKGVPDGKCPSCTEGLQYAWVKEDEMDDGLAEITRYRPFTFGDAGKQAIWRGK